MRKENERLYKSIAKRSFETKLNLYIFKMALSSGSEVVEIKADNFNDFEINIDIIEKYTAEYWQTERHEKIYNKKVDDIYHWMNDLKVKEYQIIESLRIDYIKRFNQVFSEEDFGKLLDGKECHYCGLTIENVKQLAKHKNLFKKNERGWSLEIDRINSNLEYTMKNCVMSCYWCNNAKTDEFTEAEFLKIGNSISEVWAERLRKSNVPEKEILNLRCFKPDDHR